MIPILKNRVRLPFNKCYHFFDFAEQDNSKDKVKIKYDFLFWFNKLKNKTNISVCYECNGLPLPSGVAGNVACSCPAKLLPQKKQQQQQPHQNY